MHVTGVQLDLYTGVAATLRFPLPEMDAQLESAAGKGKGGKGVAIGGGAEAAGGYESDFSATTVDGGDGGGYVSRDGGFDDDDEGTGEGGDAAAKEEARMRQDMGF